MQPETIPASLVATRYGHVRWQLNRSLAADFLLQDQRHFGRDVSQPRLLAQAGRKTRLPRFFAQFEGHVQNGLGAVDRFSGSLT